MSIFPWISPIEQAKRFNELFAVHQSATRSLVGLEEIVAEILLEPGERLLVFPRPSLLSDHAWGRFRDVSGLPRGVRRGLPWFIQTLKKAGFLIDDNLADESLGMDHSERFVRTISPTREGYAAWEMGQISHFLTLPVLVDIEVGKSPFKARESILSHRHFPLDPIAVLAMLYTHHEELGETTLWLDAVGAEVSPKGDGRFDDTPYFDRRGRSLVNLDWNWGQRRRNFRFAPSARLP